jgi:hypothetical protein
MVFFASIIGNIALYLVDLDELHLHAVLPSEASYTEKGTVHLFGKEHEVEFVEATGKIHFINTDQRLAKWFGGFLMGIVCILLYIFLMFKRFIVNVYKGYIFEHFNIRMLKNMAYGLIAFWGFMLLYSRLFYYYIGKNAQFKHLTVSDNLNSYGFLLAIALFLWILSHIFMTGVKMQDEQNFTI